MKTIRFALLAAIVMFGCTKVHKIRDTTSLKLEIIEDEVDYRDGDTLALNLKLTNASKRELVITGDHRSFVLVSLSPTDTSWKGSPFDRTYWFLGVDEGIRSDSLLQTLKAGDSQNFAVKFAPLESTANFPELGLLAVYHVTVEIDTMSTEFRIWSHDAVRLVTEQ